MPSPRTIEACKPKTQEQTKRQKKHARKARGNPRCAETNGENSNNLYPIFAVKQKHQDSLVTSIPMSALSVTELELLDEPEIKLISSDSLETSQASFGRAGTVYVAEPAKVDQPDQDFQVVPARATDPEPSDGPGTKFWVRSKDCKQPSVGQV
ncbi:hypothetical protein NDU88_008839 [Pleurodeles waltl]|uniref:Uncharacterized protein n=1 Tax=Pleurodeles waltl TaxID=8319 RepID=A0AAV7RUZ3_PLEWA|nr:hypothetical protein NDU88_008839 [Pleurodeles waltl]